MGCKNYHGDERCKNGGMGISARTTESVLKLHDQRNRAYLAARAGRANRLSAKVIILIPCSTPGLAKACSTYLHPSTASTPTT
jgi:hypothetical protein